MPQLIPLTNDGARQVTVATNAGVYTFTTYYVPLIQSWLMDIDDADGNRLITGMNLVSGVDNLLKGSAGKLNGATMRVYCTEGENNTPDSLGVTSFLVLFSQDEEIPEYDSNALQI